MTRYTLDKTREHQASLGINNPRDFIDFFLIKMEQEKHNHQSEYTLESLTVTIADSFAAGTETVSTTLRHGLFLLLKHPDVTGQRKQQRQKDLEIAGNWGKWCSQALPPTFSEMGSSRCYLSKFHLFYVFS